MKRSNCHNLVDAGVTFFFPGAFSKLIPFHDSSHRWFQHSYWWTDAATQSTCWMEIAVSSSLKINVSEVIPSETSWWSSKHSQFVSDLNTGLKQCRLYIGIVLAMIAQAYHCIQYRDIWQLFVGVNSVELPIVIVQENELSSFVMGYYVTYFHLFVLTFHGII